MKILTKLGDVHRKQVETHIIEAWVGPILVTNNRVFDARDCPGLVCIHAHTHRLLGYLLYHIEGQNCEITALNRFVENQGVGTALMKRMEADAGLWGCARTWLVTTNDNTHAIRFYQKIGTISMRCAGMRSRIHVK